MARFEGQYGSEVIVRTLQAIGIRYAAMNPGASWRGLHSSLVEAEDPELIMTLQENVAVAIAHGYAKATGEPMAAILHNMVGLQTGSMGIFNALIDNAPVLVLGGSGPADQAQRRPWIDWIHTARPQSAIVRDIVKWDDEPVSVDAIAGSLLRAHRTAIAAPQGPVYVNFDALLQEERIDGRSIEVPDGPMPPSGLSAPTADLERMADVLSGAQRPVILADAVGRSQAGYEALVRLAETLQAPVVDLGARHNFPAGHPLDQALRRLDVLADADVVLVLDSRDLEWAITRTRHEDHASVPATAPDAKILTIGLTDLMNRGFLNREALLPVTIGLTADTAVVLPALADLVAARAPDVSGRAAWISEQARVHAERVAELRAATSPDGGPVAVAHLVRELGAAVANGPWLLAFAGTAPSGRAWQAARATWAFDRYNCYLGPSGGAGLGYGLGAAIGAALAHRDDDTLVVSLQADGDALYTPQALWTAAHHGIPLLVVMLNNRSYGQDRMHQSLVTRERGADMAKVPIGIDIDGPDVDFAGLARAQGVEAFGPLTSADGLRETLAEAVRIVREERRPVLVDVMLPRPTF